MDILAVIVLGYLLGSVPFALVVGKVFYNTDVRRHGSGNLGGGNTGRVLGKKAGLAVMALDLLKVTFVIFITSYFSHAEIMMVVAGLAAAMGHCFPVFARFKGGKAVATMYGFLFGLVLFADYSPWIFFLPLLVFLLVLYLWKIIALASIVSAAAVTVYVAVTTDAWLTVGALCVFTIVIVVRHRNNLLRMRNHTENKISWM